MTATESQTLNEVHEMLTNFTKTYYSEFAGKEFSPDPTNPVICPKKLG